MGGIAIVSVYLLAVAVVLIIICFAGTSRHEKKGEGENNTVDNTTNSTTNSTTTEDA